MQLPLKSSTLTGAFSVQVNAVTKPNQTKGGVPMSFEAISNIAQAEAEAKASVANAQLRAKQLAADAESAGKLAVESALQKADEELKELRRPRCAPRRRGSWIRPRQKLWKG